MPTGNLNTAGSNGGSRRKARPAAKNNVAAGLLTGAVLAAVVGGGVVAFGAVGDGGKSGDNQVLQLNTARDGSKSDDGLVHQLPVASDSGTSNAPSGGGLVIPDFFEIPDLTIPDLTVPDLTVPGFGVGSPGTAPTTPQVPSVPGTSGSPSSPTSPAQVPPVTGLHCPDHEATATLNVNTVYPGGGSANTVPLVDGTVRATRIAAGPCEEQVVELPVSGGTASGKLGYGAWVLKVEGRDPATTWPAVAVTSANPVSSVVDVAGTCPSTKTAVSLAVSVRTVVLVPLVTPLALGTVQATPTGSGRCKPQAVSISLDLLGTAKVSLAPGSWALSVNGKSVYSGSSTLVATDSGGSKSVALVVQ